MKRYLAFFFLLNSLLFSNESSPTVIKNQILYLMQAGQTSKSIQLYETCVKENGAHDFKILEDLAHILLSRGATSTDEECQLLSMYGAGIAQAKEAIELYDLGISSHNPMTQMATIQFLRLVGDDRAEELLLKAFSSPFLIVRMEAAYALALRKSNLSTGIIESLMQRLPPPFRIYFPELFAMIGSQDAIGIMKRLCGDPQLPVRLSTILAAAKFGRDDFLTTIRASLTHADDSELETCAAAAGFLKDSHSLSHLKKLARSNSTHVKLAACRSLSLLGEHSYRETIVECARKKDPMAILLLGNIPTSEIVLTELLKDYHFYIRVNAALTLLEKRHPACTPTLIKMLIKDSKDLGFQPVFSAGNTLMSWKVIASATQYAKKTNRDIPSITFSLRESILQQALELPQDAFLEIAQAVFNQKQNELIPLLVHLLENLGSPEAIALLQEQSRHVAAPFIRTYCHLALYRLKAKGPHSEILFKWIEDKKDHELIRFRPLLPWTERHSKNSTYLLTPEETSHLLLEAFETLAGSHDMEGIRILVNAIGSGNKKNKYALAGLLLKAIQ